MPLSPSYLSGPQRGELLAHVRNEIGTAAYGNMVDAVGEDAILSYLLAAAPTQSAVVDRWARVPWVEGLSVAFSFARNFPMPYGMLWDAEWPWWLWWIVPLAWIGVAGPVALLVIPAALFGVFLVATFWFAIGGTHEVGRQAIIGLIGVGCAAGIIYGLWFAVPWVIQGVGLWWGWLGGRFVGA